MKKIHALMALMTLMSLPLLAFDLKSELSKDLKKYVNALPGKGIVSDELKLEGIVLSNFKMMGGKKLLTCEPNECIDCQVNYKIDKDALSSLSVHSCVVGFHSEGPQERFKTFLGLMNDSGTAKFQLEAPSDEGVYEIRFAQTKGITEGQAFASWNDSPPSSNATMGIVIVKP